MMTDTHRMSLRIYFEDTDSGGIVYYANYLKFAERGRTEFLRDLGIESRTLMDTLGVGLVVRRCNIDYLQPARLDDDVTVETQLQKLGGASLHLHQMVRRGDEDLVSMQIKLACIHLASGRPAALPGSLTTALAKQINATSSPNNR
jgi:acyl-CoA thioester hydrolase